MSVPSSPTPTSPGAQLRRLPGLTGLRGIAVVAVVAYHLGYLRGGFVGVDLFFVLSGYLITSLLMNQPPGSVASMRRWWAGRIRRLMPASAAVVLAVLIAFATMSGIALDALATMTWWQNWHLIAEGVPYWSRGASPLRHAWSLSIEEQFYLAWPPILLGTLAVARRGGRGERPGPVVATVAGVLAAASFAWSAVLSTRPGLDLSRIYFGTDTRAGAILVGAAAAAMVHRPPQTRIRPTAALPPAPRWTAPAAVPAVAVMVALAVTMQPSDQWAYRGGLLAAAAASLVLVAAATRRGVLSRLVDNAPLQWLGSRSYAIYLWSWPAQILFETEAPSWSQWQVAAATVAVTLPLSELSMRLVEEPLRLRTGWGRRATPRRVAWGVGLVALCGGMIIAANSTELTVAEVVAEDFEKLPDPGDEAEPVTDDADGPTTTAPTTTICLPPPAVPLPDFAPEAGEFNSSTVEEVADPTVGERCVDTIRLLVLGDSTGRGAANGLKRAAPANVEVWDRTELGCGFVVETPECTDWTTLWPAAVTEVDPDIVVVVARVSENIRPGDGPAFVSPEGVELRRAAMVEAMQQLSAGGASTVWTTTPIPAGTFYCDGRATDSGCDPVWVDQWNQDVAAAAALSGASVVDVAGWVHARDRGLEDRPDGMHLSGPALVEQAHWMQLQLISLG